MHNQQSPLNIVPIHSPLASPEVSPDPLVLGAKGAGMMRLASWGVRTPPGFIIPIGFHNTVTASQPHDDGREDKLDASIPEAVLDAIVNLEEYTGRRLGDAQNPLWVSVRSSGVISMPGMMDTFLNIGVTPMNASLRWPNVPLDGVSQHYIHQVERWSHHVEGHDFLDVNGVTDPQQVRQRVIQLFWQCVQAVWQSAQSQRALSYLAQCSGRGFAGETMFPEPHSIAVVVQEMIRGDVSETSGTGVLFTRCPETGVPGLFGEWLGCAQGEAIVSGMVTPQPLETLQNANPSLYTQLEHIGAMLEKRCGDIQDIEFTVENNVLWILQTRPAKRSAIASFRYAYDRVVDEKLPVAQALDLVPPRSVDGLLYAQCIPLTEHVPLVQGLGVSPGAAVGVMTLDPANVRPNFPSILVCHSTTADDVPAMLKAHGVLTLHGGRTSHAAVIMRGAGKPCVTALPHAHIAAGGVWIADQWIPEGSIMTVDGSTGYVYLGEVPIQPAAWTDQCATVLQWADERSRLNVWANADTPADVARALQLGAKGIGLCRSEHMMLDSDSLLAWQQWILAPSTQQKDRALQQLESLHYKSLVDILEAAKGYPFVWRLLDPPLHEFLPAVLDEKHRLYQEWQANGQDIMVLQEKIAQLRPVNPMMGLRGCRLGIIYPQVYRMQIRAFIRAIQWVQSHRQTEARTPDQTGWCGILVPLVSHGHEIRVIAQMIQDIAAELNHPPLPCGVMIETPRAALMAHEWSPWIDFVSFGTNDLTQMTWGLSRDDSDDIMRHYSQAHILDPFDQWDEHGVGQLVRGACHRILNVKPHMRISVCGEHASLPEAASFFQSVGIHTLSCAPCFVPRMRMAVGLAGGLQDGKEPPPTFQ